MVEDHRTLIELGVQPHGTIQLEMTSSDPENHPIRPVKPQQDYNMPDVITVCVQTGIFFTSLSLPVFWETIPYFCRASFHG